MRVVRAITAAALAVGLTAGSTRLRIINGCGTEALWIAHQGQGGIGPDPQNVRIDPQRSYDFITYNGLSATRYWAKMGCDEMGNHCGLGESGGPGEACLRPGDDYSRCAPPVDTKFEATFGREGAPCDPTKNNMEGCDYVDISLVDGFTLPFKLEVKGYCEKGVKTIDCSDLSFDQCPTTEYLHAAGMVTNLQAINPHTNQVVGCYSPCEKLIDDKWNKIWHTSDTPEAAPYCCPEQLFDPEQCRAGPIKDTSFVQFLHRKCPEVLSYAYDDGTGLMRCDATTQYEMTFFCPPQPIQKVDTSKRPSSLKDILRSVFTFGGLLNRFKLPEQRDFLHRPGKKVGLAALAGIIVLGSLVAGVVAFTVAIRRSTRARWETYHHPQLLPPSAAAAMMTLPPSAPSAATSLMTSTVPTMVTASVPGMVTASIPGVPSPRHGG